MNKSDYNGVYEELVELLGLDNTLKIHKHFRGQQVNFPMRLYSKEYIEEYLIKNYNGKNLKELSKKLDYTTNWLRKMLNKIEFSIGLIEVVSRSNLGWIEVKKINRLDVRTY